MTKRALFAEFVVVVLGVLIALAADSAADRFRERTAAHEALAAIRADVAADAAQLEDRLTGLLRQEDAARKRLEVFLLGGAEIADSIQFIRDLRVLMNYPSFDPRTAAIESLVSSGRIDLLDNGDLRAAILAYRSRVENVLGIDQQQRPAVFDLSVRLLPSLVGGLIWSTNQSELRSGSNLESTRAAAARALDAGSLRRSGALRELLVSTAQFFDRQRNFYTGTLSQARDLVVMLDTALSTQ